jgi:uncharacterized sulfatase
VLSLCGVERLTQFQGSAFLGADGGTPREFVHGARDRVDEAFDVARSVRDGRWLYIRNFMPHLSWMQPEGYSDQSTFRRELKLLAAKNELKGGAKMYAAPRRPLEELYDTQADPAQLHNLADDAQHQATLKEMRIALRQWQLETRDAGFITEPDMWSRLNAAETPCGIAQVDTRYPLARLLDAAAGVGRDDQAAKQRDLLQDADAGVRYWAALGLRARSALDEQDRAVLRAALKDAAPVVRIEAATALASHDEAANALPVLQAALSDPSREIALHAARALELLGPAARPLHADMRAVLETMRVAEQSDDTMAMFVRFALEAALQP